MGWRDRAVVVDAQGNVSSGSPGAQAPTSAPSDWRSRATDAAPILPISGDKTEASSALLQGFGQGGTLGYLPQLQAGAGVVGQNMASGLGMMPGEQPDSYSDLRKYFLGQNETLKKEHPVATLAGNLAGAGMTSLAPGALLARLKGATGIAQAAKAAATAEPVAELMQGGANAAESAPGLINAGEGRFITGNVGGVPAPITPPAASSVIGGELATNAASQAAPQAAGQIANISKGVTLAKIGKAAATGAAYGGAANPETENTDADPNAALKARLRGAGYGAALGGGAETLLGGIGAGISKTGENLTDRAVVKQIGANAGQVKKILQKDDIPRIEGFLNNEGLMTPGNSIDTVADHTGKIIEQDGPKIAQLYRDAQAKAEALHANAAATGEIPMARSADGAYSPVQKINGDQLADKIIADTKFKFKAHADRDEAVSQMEKAVGPLRDLGPDASLDDLHTFRKSLDENVNWGSKGNERPAVQRAYIDARNTVADKAKSTIDQLDQATGGNQLNELKALNDRFSAASTVNSIAEQAKARDMAKSLMGHGIIGGGAGAVAGYETYKKTGSVFDGLAAGAGTALGIGALRKYGTPITYYGGRALEGAGKGAEFLTPNATQMGAGAVSPWVNMQKLKEDKKNGR